MAHGKSTIKRRLRFACGESSSKVDQYFKMVSMEMADDERNFRASNRMCKLARSQKSVRGGYQNLNGAARVPYFLS